MEKYGAELIYETEDQFGKIEVLERLRYRSLHFGNFSKQSEMCIDKPELLTLEYMQHMAGALLFAPRPKHVLVLGMGGGNFARFMHSFFPESFIDICELRPQVSRIAQIFFKLPNSRLRIFNIDAFEFLKYNSSKEYDLIFVDIFDAQGASISIEKRMFFSYLFRSLKKTGVISTNLWSTDPHKSSLLEKASQNFSREFLCLPTQYGNVAYLTIPKFKKSVNFQTEKFIQNYSAFMGIPFREIFYKIESENNFDLSLKNSVEF